MNIPQAEMESLVHAFETLEGIEQRIDLRRISRGSYANALRSMGQDMDAAAALMGSHGKKPENTLELLIFCFNATASKARQCIKTGEVHHLQPPSAPQ